ncbi:MAG: hypothetical protein MUF71_00975 [Candidatus Kapabacteria bacterium]|jgi:hypothetical protein|nr:hypothetical protein [Candidatus Kapabacteria bacterium]
MNTLNEYSALLYTFLDGDLAPEQEIRLFAALSHDDDLRNELKDALLINRTIADDSGTLFPSAASDEALFARLGFMAKETPLAPVPLVEGTSNLASNLTSRITSPMTAQTLTFGVRLWNGVKRGGTMLLVALLASLLTAWLLRSGNTNYNGGNESLSTFNGFLPPIRSDDGWGVSGLGTSPQPFILADTVVRTITRTIVRNVVQETMPQKKQEAMQLDSDVAINTSQTQGSSTFSQEKSYSATIQPSTTTPHEASSNFAQPSNQVTNQSSNQATKQPSNQALTGISVSVRGLIGRSLIWATLPAKEQFPSNLAVGAMYALSPQHSVGVEAGQEAYFQRFFTRDANEVEYRVEQHPTFLWAGLAYRFTLLPESALSPFAHIVAGATEIGGMGRGMVGFSYTPDTRTMLFLGAELSSLLYQSEGAWYLSPKAGVSYGVSVRF